jgi:site-specific DNA-methyltransferase (adenine-specific)
MRELVPDSSINLIVTSPPYNCGIAYSDYNDLISWGTYFDWVELWLKECYRVLKDDGRICINIPIEVGKKREWSWDNHTTNTKRHIQVEYNNIMVMCGFNIFTHAIWNKTQKSKLTAWGSWLSAKNPYIFSPYEVIIIAFKKQWARIDNGISTISKKEFIEAASGIWNFAASKDREKCPVPFPEQLPMRCIQLLSYKGDDILDPFMGNGTTGAACWKSQRNFIGFEISASYFEYAKKNLALLERGIFE